MKMNWFREDSLEILHWLFLEYVVEETDVVVVLENPVDIHAQKKSNDLQYSGESEHRSKHYEEPLLCFMY